MLNEGAWEHNTYSYSPWGDVASSLADDGRRFPWSNVSASITVAMHADDHIVTIHALREEIRHFRDHYPDGWDGPDSRGPTAATAQVLMGLLDRIPSGLTLPMTMLSRDGELGLYWDFENEAYADLGVDAQGRISLFSRDVQGQEFFEEPTLADFDAAWYWRKIGCLALTRKHLHAA